MNRNRYHPAVVVWNHSQELFFEQQIRALDVPVYALPSTLSRTAKLRAFRHLVQGISPEVVHSYSFHTNFAVWYATLGSSVIPLGSIRKDFLSEREKVGKVLGRLSAYWPRIQICNSLAAKETAEKSKGSWKPKAIFFVRNSIDLAQFRSSSVPQGTPTLLAVGRLFPHKRWDRLLSSIALVAAKGLKFKLLHAGDGPLRAELEIQARKLGLDEIIHFLGVRRDISVLLADSTFLVHTSDDEGCPNVVMEAMACGRAVVATDAGDVPYLVESGKTGFVVPRGDESLLVKSIIELISRYDLSCRMGEAGRSKAEKEFGLDRLLLETLAVYRAAGWEDK